MSPDQTLLQDMVTAAAAIEQFTAGMTADQFSGAEIVKSAVVFQLIVLGEAANRLSPELKAKHTHVRWRVIIDQRNVVAHGYFALDWSLVWTTAVSHVPVLRKQIEDILSQELPTNQSDDHDR